jgi:hypothetical protein
MDSAGSDGIATKVIVALLIAVALTPTLLVHIPAMVDYPNHLARMYLLARDGTPAANPYYRVAWALYPNLAMDLVVPLVARWVSVETALRLFLLVSQGLIVAGAMVLERVVKGGVALAGFAAVMFLYCLPFAWGFVNFEFGLGLALCGIAAMLAVQDRGFAVRLIVNGVFVVALYAAHFFAFGVYGATLGLLELCRASERKAPHAETAGRLAVLAAPAVVVLVAMALTGGAVGSEGNEWHFAFKPIWPFRILNGDSLGASAAGVLVLLALIYVAVKHKWLTLSRPGCWIGLGFVALYILIPSRLLGTAFTDFRMLAAGALILPAFCTLRLPDARARLVAVAAAAAITLANVGVVAAVWLSYRADYAAVIESFGRLDRGALVLIGTTGPGDDPPFRNITDYPMYYAPTLAVAYCNCFVPTLFTAVGKQPVQAQGPVQRLAIPHGGPVPLTILTAIAAGKTAPAVPAFVASWQRDYDYLYLLGPRIDNPLPDRLTELTSSARFTLYRINR